VNRCPIGTFSDQIANQALSDCASCSPGYFCEVPGLTFVSGPCEAGYYCISGATSSVQPVDSSMGGTCPAGSYCQEASAYYTKCPRGTYMPTTGSKGNVTYGGINFFCYLCPAGKVCDGVGLTTYTGTCGAGYWCSGLADVISFFNFCIFSL
jgi:hypothetical protein